MQALSTVLLVVMILSALTMVGLILIQHGKGADMGAAFGSGASGSLFGATGSANFLSRATAILAAVFFACTLALAYFGYSAQPASSGSVLERAAPAAPATPPSPANQIPGGGTPVPAQQGPATTPATAAPVTPAAPATPASGAGQIPAR
ncbi:MAG TPA: preprotein translocase subunit SecG [Ramlibacter sp.]|nr:preprotein translocase subunit SecG [Ramlibacter sp.]